MRNILNFTIIILISHNNFAHGLKPDSLQTRQKKLIYYTASSGIYGSTMTGLGSLWYADYSTSSFHWFDDSHEWLMIDKAGHFYGTYQTQMLSYHALRWASKRNKVALAESAITTWLAFSGIEIFDGFSKGWGASVSDLAANTAGIGLFTLQQSLWNEQRIVLKFGYIPGNYAQYRPDLLGNSPPESLLKDYNAQTYWLSFSPGSFGLPFPKWLAVSAGYGADGMLGAKTNPDEWNGNTLPSFSRKRQFYLSPDIDFSKIKIRNKWFKLLFYGLNMVKMPLPAIEFSGKKIRFHPLFI